MAGTPILHNKNDSIIKHLIIRFADAIGAV